MTRRTSASAAEVDVLLRRRLGSRLRGEMDLAIRTAATEGRDPRRKLNVARTLMVEAMPR